MSAAGPLVSLETIIQCTSQRTLSQINGVRQIHNDGQGGGSASAAAAVAAVECEHFNAADVQFYSEVSFRAKMRKCPVSFSLQGTPLRLHKEHLCRSWFQQSFLKHRTILVHFGPTRPSALSPSLYQFVLRSLCILNFMCPGYGVVM